MCIYNEEIDNNDNDGDGNDEIYMIVETPLAPSLLTESNGLELVNLGAGMISMNNSS